MIRKRRNGLQVQVYAGRDPLTGRKRWVSRQVPGQTKRSYRDAKKIEAELLEQVGEAKAAARRLGTDHADLHTIFGPTSLAIQGVQVAAELGDGREVLRRARFVEPTRLPPYLLERRTHLLIDVARGHAHRADDPAAVATLLEAEQLAPEEVRYNPLASELVIVLLERERRAATPGLRDLSARIGVVA